MNDIFYRWKIFPQFEVNMPMAQMKALLEVIIKKLLSRLNNITFKRESNEVYDMSIITPAAIDYEYKLMFEERKISLLTYNKDYAKLRSTLQVLKKSA